MTIVGIGIDIVEIKRIQNIISRRGNCLAARILTSKEYLEYQKKKYSVHFLAKRFAAKEAAAKALGMGIRKGLTFIQFEITNNILGKPSLRLFSQALVLANQLDITNMLITLSDERHYACATVIFEK